MKPQPLLFPVTGSDRTLVSGNADLNCNPLGEMGKECNGFSSDSKGLHFPIRVAPHRSLTVSVSSWVPRTNTGTYEVGVPGRGRSDRNLKYSWCSLTSQKVGNN